MAGREVNFDGIVGPTHNYAGLSYGNVASMSNRSSTSHPRDAALEGLAKMKLLADMGVAQAVLPPQERPHLPTLRRLGFSGSDTHVLETAHRADPVLLAAVSSASSMWAANAATVSPSADCADGRVHFTPANLSGNFHRSIESAATTRVLRTIFSDPRHFVVHDPLPASLATGDEGAANHMRFAAAHGEPGIEVFAFGRRAFDAGDTAPTRFPARQTFEACTAIARQHLLRPDRVVFLRQSAAAIDAGAFHNDVVAVSNQLTLLCHQHAYVDTLHGLPAGARVFTATQVSLADAVRSYVFNSQLVTLPDTSVALIAPVECQEFESVQAYLAELKGLHTIDAVHYVDVRHSMRNGGGPACLRLRVALSDAERESLSANAILTPRLFAQLVEWVNRHYRETLDPDDLRDPKLLQESRDALDALTKLLAVGPVFDFQQS